MKNETIFPPSPPTFLDIRTWLNAGTPRKVHHARPRVPPEPSRPQLDGRILRWKAPPVERGYWGQVWSLDKVRITTMIQGVVSVAMPGMPAWRSTRHREGSTPTESSPALTPRGRRSLSPPTSLPTTWSGSSCYSRIETSRWCFPGVCGGEAVS